MFVIVKDDLAGAPTQKLLAFHLTETHKNSPPGSIFALDLSGLSAPEVTVWSVWHGDEIAGIGAMKNLGDGRCELKSMRTHPDFLRRGAASMLLAHLIGEAKRLGMKQLCLETGRGTAFEPALNLYRSRGFVDGPAFADYHANTFSQFLHLSL